MEFKDQLNTYISLLDCKAKTLSEASGLSATVISRYRSGERLPAVRSPQLNQLCHGIGLLAEQRSLPDLSEENVYTSFMEILNRDKIDPFVLGKNLTIMISLFAINKSELSRYLNYDPSYLSRICSGQRTPSDPHGFVREICGFIVHKYTRKNDRAAVASLLGCSAEELNDESYYLEKMMEWFGSKNAVPEDTDHILNYLKRLDSSVTDFIPVNSTGSESSPDYSGPSRQLYFNSEGIKRSQLDFFLLTARADQDREVYLFCDIPPAVLEQDSDFFTSWMSHISELQMHGFEIHVILNFEQSIYKTVHYIRKWLPVSVSGKFHLYFIKEPDSSILGHFLCVSSMAVVTGESFNDHPGMGEAVLLTEKNEIDHFHGKIRMLLTYAQPMMEIYKEENHEEYLAFLKNDALLPGTRRNLTPSLPAFVYQEDELRSLLEQSGISNEKCELFVNESLLQISRVQEIMKNGHLHFEILRLTEQDFEQGSREIYLDGTAMSVKCTFSYEKYMQYLEKVRAYKETHPNFAYRMSSARSLPNLQIIFHRGYWAMITRRNLPSVIFIILYPKLRIGIEDLALSDYFMDDSSNQL